METVTSSVCFLFKYWMYCNKIPKQTSLRLFTLRMRVTPPSGSAAHYYWWLWEFPRKSPTLAAV